LAFSISVTSRKPRINEKEGVDYYFMDNDTFKKRALKGDFLEWEEVYAGTCYGTLKSEVERLLTAGKNVVFDVDVVGGVNIKKQYGDEALSLFIQPPSVEELRKRLTNRQTDTLEVIEKRVAKATQELKFAPEFDHIIINDILEEACRETDLLVNSFIHQ
jgi:guanylate kinase